MTLAADLEATPGLAGAHHPGLQALTSADRAHVAKRDATRLSGSVNLDATLEPLYPTASRWDYGIGQRRAGKQRDLLHWVEVHPASGGGHVHEVERKAAWLLGWMKQTPLWGYERRLVWVASGRSAYNARDPSSGPSRPEASSSPVATWRSE
jgi:hypothetical protein